MPDPWWPVWADRLEPLWRFNGIREAVEVPDAMALPLPASPEPTIAPTGDIAPSPTAPAAPPAPLAAWDLAVSYAETRADYNIDWNVGYDLSFDGSALTVTTRIALTGSSPGSLPLRWEQGIEQTWAGFALAYGDARYAVRFDVQFVAVGAQEHYDVNVIAASGRDDMLNWYTQKAGWGDAYQELVQAHEYGHMIGNFDEYSGGATLNGVVKTGTLMSDLTATGVFPYYFASIEQYAEIGAGGGIDFTVVQLPADTLAPTVLSFTPAAGAIDVALQANVVVTFSEWIYRGSGTLSLRDGSGTLVESFDAATSARLTFARAELRVDPTQELRADTTYTLTLATGSVEDAANNPLAAPASVTFSTDRFGNRAPVGSNGSFSVDEDLSLSTSLPPATDPESAAVTYSLATGASHGTAVVSAAGGFTYTPAPDYAGTDRFTFNVADPLGVYNTYAIDITVREINDAPVVAAATFNGTEDRTLSGVVQRSDVDGDVVSLAVTGTPSHGSVTLSSATRRFTYTPDPNYAGPDAFIVTGSDGRGGTASATMTLVIQAVNDSPSAAPVLGGAAVRGQTLHVVSPPADADGIDLSTLTYRWRADGVEIAGAVGEELLLTPTLVGRAISVEARYTDLGGTAERIASTATLPVADFNAPPTGADGSFTTLEDRLLSGILPAAVDPEGEAITYQLDTPAAHGRVQVAAGGGFTYLPDPNYAGPDGFTYSISDPRAASHTYAIALSVTEVNDVPVILDARFEGTEDTALSALFAASDVDGDNLSINIIREPLHGSARLSEAGRRFTYTPSADFCGDDDFLILALDGRGGSEQALIRLHLQGTNDAPTAAPSIAGTPSALQTLRVNTPPQDPDGIDPATLTYQWLADGEEIEGATGESLLLEPSLLGHTIAVQARYTDLGGKNEQITSAATERVADSDRDPVAPSGIAAIDALHAGVRWSPDVDGALQWSISGGLGGEGLSGSGALRSGIESLLASIAAQTGLRFTFAGTFGSPSEAAAAGSVLNFAPSTDRSLFASPGARVAGFGPALPAGQERYVGQAGDLHLAPEAMAVLSTTPIASNAIGLELMRELLRALGVARVSPSSDLPWPLSALPGDVGPDLAPLASLSDAGGVGVPTPASPMVLDLLALQHLYGTNATTRSGNSALAIGASNAPSVRWDAGGSDTVSAALADEAWTIQLPEPAEDAPSPQTRVGWALPSSAVPTASLQELQWFSGALEHAAGSSFGDRILGNDLANTLFGDAGNDTLSGGGGADRIDGGLGKDVARYSGPLADYRITRTGATVGVADPQAGRDGDDQLRTIERLQFSDLSVNLTVQDAAAAIEEGDLLRLVELYIGFFGRVPAADGLEYWVGEVQRGRPLVEIAETLYDLGSGPDLREATGYWNFVQDRELSDADYVRVVYRNVLAREARPEGVTYWSAQLADTSRGELVCKILDAAHALSSDAAWGWVAQLLEDRADMSLTIARDWGLNYGATPQESITKGRAIADSVIESANPNFPDVPIKVYDFDGAVALVGVAPDHLQLT